MSVRRTVEPAMFSKTKQIVSNSYHALVQASFTDLCLALMSSYTLKRHCFVIALCDSSLSPVVQCPPQKTTRQPPLWALQHAPRAPQRHASPRSNTPPLRQAGCSLGAAWVPKNRKSQQLERFLHLLYKNAMTGSWIFSWCYETLMTSPAASNWPPTWHLRGRLFCEHAARFHPSTVADGEATTHLGIPQSSLWRWPKGTKWNVILEDWRLK